MIQLTERQRLIVEDLLNIISPISAKELAKKFNVSVRTIRYDLDDIEYWLKSRDTILIKKQNVGIWLNLNEKKKCCLKKAINVANLQNKVLSKQERHYIIIFELLKSIKPITAEFLSEKLGVSRTTILKDMKEVNRELLNYEVSLKSRQRIGYKVVGSERNIRKLIGHILMESMDRQELLEIVSNIKSKGMYDTSVSLNIESLNNLSSQINIKDIKRVIKSSKEIYDFWIPDSSYVSLLVHLAIAMDRLIKGQNIKLSRKRIDTIKEHREYLIGKEIGKRLSEIYNITVPEEEIANIAMHLISADLKLKQLNDESLFDSKEYLSEVLDEMLGIVKGNFLLSGYSYKKLKKDLLSHLQLTLKKFKLNITIHNPLINQIKTNYSASFEAAKKMALIFKEQTSKELPESEIGYIALHLAAHIETSKNNEKKKALVVCTTGKGSAKILAIRIKNSIPELEVKDIVSVFELEDKDCLLDDVDFIISTVYLKTFDKPVIKVSPLISDTELNEIKSFINEEKSNLQNKEIQQEDYMLESIMNVVGKYIEIEDKEKLRTELSYLIAFFMSNSNKPIKQIEFSEQFAQRVSLILVEIGEMLKEISEKIEVKNDISNLWGIVIHVIMSIHRWQTGKYYKEKNLHKYKKENFEIYTIIKKYLNKISKNYDLNISDTEIVAIMRYLI